MITFKDSKNEESYNKYWNSNVVNIYNQIMNSQQNNSTLFAQNREELLLQYFNHVHNVMDNLVRQYHANNYEDVDYVKNYIYETQRVAISDIMEFMSKHKDLGPKIQPYFEELKQDPLQEKQDVNLKM